MPSSTPGHGWVHDLRDAFSSLFRLDPEPAPRWAIGLRAGLAITIPVVLTTALGHPEAGLPASVGAFVALYGTQHPVAERLRLLPITGGALFLAAALGALAAPFPALTLVGLAVVTIAAAAAMFGFRFGPPGPLFVVMVYGLSAHVVSAGAAADTYLVAVAAGILFTSLLCIMPLLLPSRRARARPLREVLPGPAWPPAERMLLLRAVLVTVAGISLALLLHPERAYWIVGGAIAVIGVVADRSVAVRRALHRTIGTVLGAGVYLLLAPLIASLPTMVMWLVVALVLGVLQFTIELFVVRNYALALVFITPLVLLLSGAATGTIDSASVAVERVVDTLVGAALGAASGLLHTAPARPPAGETA